MRRGRGICRVMETRPYTANATTTTQKQSDYKVEQSSFTPIALFQFQVGRCRGRNLLNGNQASEITLLMSNLLKHAKYLNAVLKSLKTRCS